MKRAQSIGVNTVIIAAIALLVLVLIAIIVTGSGSDVREGLTSCPVRGGECLAFDPQDGRTPILDAECDGGLTCYGYVT